ncbi:hypothetical protein AB1L16_18035 [Peribacillus frigoritolerans]|uniref:hypothetical protein n=1 Tax=Peribacillus frigoritolerans TaxID=450367 RepID=UPI0039A1A654
MDILKDLRVDCFSIMDTITVRDYLDMISVAYENKGNITGQRGALKTKSSITIRNRMKEDIVKGTILPPVVIGIVADTEVFDKVEKMVEEKQDDDIRAVIASIDKNDLSIIDGMQRTTSIMESVEKNSDILSRKIRVEFWMTKTVNSLLYRMLILNTGQVPWNLKRQIEVVYNPLIKEFNAKVENLQLFSVDNPSYRTKPGQYQAEKIVELFLIFGTREPKIDTKGSLADEFTKLDFIEVTSENQLNDIFLRFLSKMIEFDEIVFPLELDEITVEGEKFKSGKDLFGSQTLKAGFMAAISQRIFGIPGEDYTLEEQNEAAKLLSDSFDAYFEKLRAKDKDELIEYLDLITLNEIMRTVNKGIGEYERQFFTKAFKTLLDNDFKFQDLTPCWRAGTK